MTVAGVIPLSIAVMYTKGLIAEPGERSALIARLNSSLPLPPTSALICPFCALIDTSATCGYSIVIPSRSSLRPVGSRSAMAFSAARWALRSIVVFTVRPPRYTLSEP
ncbi:MAG: hypothetical protein BWY85_02069 [Firmicutes bacterium ADurb.Bin506]|nr:MAG: hypothetical protein BWY85_02069 [Firmicutes bacterium ADurb.Bin506]